MSIETDYTRWPICPYCGYEEENAWELDFGDGEGEATIDCGGCEKEYIAYQNIEITYNTYKKKEKKEEEK